MVRKVARKSICFVTANTLNYFLIPIQRFSASSCIFVCVEIKKGTRKYVILINTELSSLFHVQGKIKVNLLLELTFS